MDFQQHYTQLKLEIDHRLQEIVMRHEGDLLFPPLQHVIEGGGKRIRGILAMLAAEAVGGNAGAALNAAVAVEMLHSFTLVHDDIMDRADTRRGRPTVHKQW